MFFEIHDGVAPVALAVRGMACDGFELIEIGGDNFCPVVFGEEALFAVLGALQSQPGTGDLRDEHLLMRVGRRIASGQVVAKRVHFQLTLGGFGNGRYSGRHFISSYLRVTYGALVMTSAHTSERIVRECAAAGVKKVWLHRGAGQGAVSERALKVCAGAGIEVVAGECPFMLLSPQEFPHNVHACIKKLIGRYPR